MPHITIGSRLRIGSFGLGMWVTERGAQRSSLHAADAPHPRKEILPQKWRRLAEIQFHLQEDPLPGELPLEYVGEAADLRRSHAPPGRVVEQLEHRPRSPVGVEDLFAAPYLSRDPHLACPRSDPIEGARGELRARELPYLAIHTQGDDGHRLAQRGPEREREPRLGGAGRPQRIRYSRGAIEELDERGARSDRAGHLQVTRALPDQHAPQGVLETRDRAGLGVEHRGDIGQRRLGRAVGVDGVLPAQPLEHRTERGGALVRGLGGQAPEDLLDAGDRLLHQPPHGPTTSAAGPRTWNFCASCATAPRAVAARSRACPASASAPPGGPPAAWATTACRPISASM